MASDTNRTWNIENFVDSLVVEFDKVQDTLAVKGVNRKLTYSVKDFSMDLQVFPAYDGRRVMFRTAQPGQEGASTLSLQMGSITDKQIRVHTRPPTSQDDIAIEEVDGIDDETREDLRRVGIRSAGDLERAEKRNIDLEGVVKQKRRVRKKDEEFGKLADMIKRARRQRQPPRVREVSLSRGGEGPELVVSGHNLGMQSEREGYPVAVLDGQLLDLREAGDERLRFALSTELASATGSRELHVALDPYALIRMDIEG